MIRSIDLFWNLGINQYAIREALKKLEEEFRGRADDYLKIRAVRELYEQSSGWSRKRKIQVGLLGLVAFAAGIGVYNYHTGVLRSLHPALGRPPWINPDGDFDEDGLKNKEDPNIYNPDSDGDKLLDGPNRALAPNSALAKKFMHIGIHYRENPDRTVTFYGEQSFGSDPMRVNSDGDPWTDPEEVLLGTDPAKDSHKEIAENLVGKNIAEQLNPSSYHDPSFRPYVERLSSLSDENREVYAEVGITKHHTGDGRISQDELRMAGDVDIDGKDNPSDPYPLNPLNDRELPRECKVYVIKLADYNKGRDGSNVFLGIYSDSLAKAINLVEENRGIADGFTPRESHIMVYLIKYTPEIVDYPGYIRGGTIQVDDVAYDVWIDSKSLVQVGGEENVWKDFINPAVSHVLELLKSGKIDLNGLDEKEIGQVLLPMELTTVEIKTGYEVGEYGFKTEYRWKIAKGNVTPIEGSEKITVVLQSGRQVEYTIDFNGRSPQEWLNDISREIYEIGRKSISWDEIKDISPYHLCRDDSLSYEEKVYALSLKAALGSHPYGNWEYSGEVFKENFEKVLSEDLPAVYVMGLPDGLSYISGEYVGPVPGITEQCSPYYSVLVGREFGRPTFVAGMYYPEGVATHDEAYVRTFTKINVDSAPYFGFWMSKEALRKDHEGKHPVEWLRDWKPFDLEE